MNPLERLLIRYRPALQLGSLLAGALVSPLGSNWVIQLFSLLVYG